MNELVSPKEEDLSFYLFLDIDNVLNPHTAFYSASKAWPDYKWVNKFAQSQITSPMMVAELNAFIKTYKPEVYMVSTWEERAKSFCQLIGLDGSADWPWLNSTDDRGGVWAKFGSVRETSTTPNGKVSPAIWIDDHIVDEHEAALWAAENDVLALTPTSSHGITPAHLAQMRVYAERVQKNRTDEENLQRSIAANSLKNSDNSDNLFTEAGRRYESNILSTVPVSRADFDRYL